VITTSCQLTVAVSTSLLHLAAVHELTTFSVRLYLPSWRSLSAQHFCYTHVPNKQKESANHPMLYAWLMCFSIRSVFGQYLTFMSPVLEPNLVPLWRI
jgi:hypothetical protein